MCLQPVRHSSYSILRKEDFSVMEETKEDMTNQKSGRQMTTYSAEMKLSLLTEYREVAGTVSIARFAREHDLSLGTFYGWMKKAGIKAPQPTRKAVDVRSMIPLKPVRPVQDEPSGFIPVAKAEAKPVMIPIVVNGNELMTTPEGIGIIISSLKRCSR